MLAFIGGTGLTRMENLRIIDSHTLSTRFGAPSAPIVEGELNGNKVMFLPHAANGFSALSFPPIALRTIRRFSTNLQ